MCTDGGKKKGKYKNDGGELEEHLPSCPCPLPLSPPADHGYMVPDDKRERGFPEIIP